MEVMEDEVSSEDEEDNEELSVVGGNQVDSDLGEAVVIDSRLDEDGWYNDRRNPIPKFTGLKYIQRIAILP